MHLTALENSHVYVNSIDRTQLRGRYDLTMVENENGIFTTLSFCHSSR